MSQLENDRNFQELVAQTQVSGELMTDELFVKLCEQFYNLGWMRGSGGAMGCIVNDLLLVSPSGVQKERMKITDIFIYSLKTKKLVQSPLNVTTTVSSCGVLFTSIMNKTGSKCVIHTHSQYSNLLTRLLDDTFSISHQEYIKGVYHIKSGKNMAYDDVLRIPIIENAPSESLLLNPIDNVLLAYSNDMPSAVLVRNHGLFVWGPTWEATKIMLECIEYLCELAIQLIKLDKKLVLH